MNGQTTAERVMEFLKDDFTPPGNSVLTTAEWDCYSLLSAAFNAFLKLPKVFQGDQGEFALHINAAKNIVMARPAAHELMSVYSNYPAVIDNVAAAGQPQQRPQMPALDLASSEPPASIPGGWEDFVSSQARSEPPDAEVDPIKEIRPLAGYRSNDVDDA